MTLAIPERQEDFVIRAQPGAQEQFLSSSADIVIYGGAAGGGKSYALLLEPLRHIEVPGFGAVIFRRTSPQIRNEGGLWDTSEQIYPRLGLVPKESTLEWEHYHSGVTIKFSHMQYEKDKYDFDGSQIPFIGFDELIHFTESQFWYLLSRNRSVCGVKPYVRAGTNPDVDSWVARLIEWWIEQDEHSPNYGLPIPERAGIIRWFVRVNEELVWADSQEELHHDYPAIPAKSLTFIPAKLQDNAVLMKENPEYLANLMAQSRVERERLLGGNWKIRPSAGLFFQRGWFPMVEVAPVKVALSCRYWDLAGTEGEEEGIGESKKTIGPAYTAGVKMSKQRDGTYLIEHVARDRLSPFGVENFVRNIAKQDGPGVWQVVERDPGQAGKYQGKSYARLLDGYKVHVTAVPTKSKEVRVEQFSAQCEAGNVAVVQAGWNEPFFRELEEFPDGAYKDQVDAAGGGYRFLLNPPSQVMGADRVAHSHSSGMFAPS